MGDLEEKIKLGRQVELKSTEELFQLLDSTSHITNIPRVMILSILFMRYLRATSEELKFIEERLSREVKGKGIEERIFKDLKAGKTGEVIKDE